MGLGHLKVEKKRERCWKNVTFRRTQPYKGSKEKDPLKNKWRAASRDDPITPTDEEVTPQEGTPKPGR